MCQFINSNDVFANPDNKDYICYNEAFCTALSGYRYLEAVLNFSKRSCSSSDSPLSSSSQKRKCLKNSSQIIAR